MSEQVKLYCEDCRYWWREWGEYGYCRKLKTEAGEADYCSFGKDLTPDWADYEEECRKEDYRERRQIANAEIMEENDA